MLLITVASTIGGLVSGYCCSLVSLFLLVNNFLGTYCQGYSGRDSGLWGPPSNSFQKPSDMFSEKYHNADCKVYKRSRADLLFIVGSFLTTLMLFLVLPSILERLNLHIWIIAVSAPRDAPSWGNSKWESCKQPSLSFCESTGQPLCCIV